MARIVSVEIVLVALALYILKKLFLDGKQNSAPLPPGPKGFPIVGNLTDLPPPGIPEYQHWLKHKDAHGPISSVTVLGQTMIILHDVNAALELMEKRSNVNSGRPKMKFAFEMCGWQDTISSVPYGSTHRLYRKYAYQQLGTTNSIARFYPLQEQEVGRFLWRLKKDPENLVKHLKTEAGAVILKITYDYTIEPHTEDALVRDVDHALEQFSAAVVPGAWLVDVMPWLEYLPEWFPGAQFKKTARLWRKTLMDVVEVPYAYVKQKMAHRSNEDSLVSKLLEQNESTLTPEEEHAIKWSAASLYTGGADTSVSTMSTFFLAMSISPEVQRKAQEEIDRVVGTSRLPTFSDRENLPYVDAIVKEAQRFHPIAPMGLPHTADEEDIVNGYRIPKGALLIPAIWWFLHDPATYHSPMEFKPERYLEPHNEPSPNNVSWGFGRRICPGRVLADSSLYLTFAQTLAVFNIQKALDENGKEVEPRIEFEPGIISHPVPFKVRVTPRSKEHEIMIEEVVMKHPWQESDAKYIQSMKA